MASKRHEKMTGSERGRNLKAIKVGGVNPEDEVKVTIVLRGPKLPCPDEFVGRRLESEQLKKEFGAKEEDAEYVKEYLIKHELKLDEEVSLITRSMRVSGTAKAMEAVFRPDWAMMRSPTQGVYRGRKGKISIPAELKGIVTGVFGLDQRRMAHRNSGAGVFASHRTTLSPLTPECIEKRYNFPPGDGEGQTIAIAEFDGGYLAKDLKKYCKMVHRPQPKVQRIEIPPNGRALTFKQILDIQNPELRLLTLEYSFEVMMDVELIAGLCPKVSISVYFSSFDQSGWVNLLNKVITADPTPVALSISWGRAEDDDWWTDDARNAINDRLNLARLLGITICVASGDDGWRDRIDDKSAHVEFPTASPFVMGVGGTMLKQSGTSVEEVTWAEEPASPDLRGCATGGGVSQRFQRPAWQKNIHIASLNPVSIDGRVVPDVSALAGEPYYYLVFVGFPWPDGKTSASAPVWAALIARINAKLPLHKRRRFLTPLLYKKLTKGRTVGEVSFRDITIGSNAVYPDPKKGYKAGPGFDAVTGWGVPDGKKLLNCLKVI